MLPINDFNKFTVSPVNWSVQFVCVLVCLWFCYHFLLSCIYFLFVYTLWIIVFLFAECTFVYSTFHHYRRVSPFPNFTTSRRGGVHGVVTSSLLLPQRVGVPMYRRPHVMGVPTSSPERVYSDSPILSHPTLPL